jgi:hypothetical protein
METSRGLKLMFRFALFGAALMGIFWGLWALIDGSVPSAEAARLFGDKTFRIEAIASRWWDPLGVAMFTALATGVIIFRDRMSLIENNDFLWLALRACAVAGAVLGGVGYGSWTSQNSDAPYMPLVFLGLSAAFGLALGIVGVTALKWQEAVFGAFLGPLLFGLSAPLIVGFVRGFLHTLVLAGIAALSGAMLSAGLCLLTCAILKQGFWSGLGRWLVVKKAPAAAAEDPPAPAAVTPPIVPAEELPSPERAYCQAVEAEQQARTRYENAKAAREALERELGPNAPKALAQFGKRL